MFEKFGEFNSSEELNKAALAQREEGDEEALKILAKENGIDEDEVEDFMDCCMDELVTPLTAAVGKLDVEVEALHIKGILKDWVDELKMRCMNDEDFAKAVRQKGKDLAGYIALTAETGYKNRAVVDKKIVEKCKTIKGIIGNHEFSIGIPDAATRKVLAQEYYLGK